MITALFVDANGPYKDVADCWGEERDARTFAGTGPVVAHPPCERWGRYWGGGPMLAGTPKQKKLGDDGGCFAFALAQVRRCKGVLEHPAHTHAWRTFELTHPPREGGWVPAGDGIGFVCHVEQGHYGHRARKATWLYAVGCALPELKWGPSQATAKLDDGYHSTAERAQRKAEGTHKTGERLTAKERIHTPQPFRDMLLMMAASSRRHSEVCMSPVSSTIWSTTLIPICCLAIQIARLVVSPHDASAKPGTR
jgi:hypothetical protein